MNSRDKLLIRAGMWAAVMNVNDEIYFEGMFDEEPQITNFIVDAVADYIMSGSTENFDTYIRDILKDEFEKKTIFTSVNLDDILTCDECNYKDESLDYPECQFCITRCKKEERFAKESDA